MPWVRFDDQYPINRKVARLSDAAYRLDSEAIMWSNRETTDGIVRTHELTLIRSKATRRHAAELVEAGRWHVAGFECGSSKCPPSGPDGWVIHDYFDYQPTRDRVEQERASKVARQHRWMARKRGQDYDDIDPLVVYQRDGWTCWICQGAVTRGARTGDVHGPSLDHVKPTSQGGKHTYDNVRCAHIRCNNARGARPDSDTSKDASRNASLDVSATPTPPPTPLPKGSGEGTSPKRPTPAGQRRTPRPSVENHQPPTDDAHPTPNANPSTVEPIKVTSNPAATMAAGERRAELAAKARAALSDGRPATPRPTRAAAPVRPGRSIAALVADDEPPPPRPREGLGFCVECALAGTTVVAEDPAAGSHCRLHRPAPDPS